MSAAALKRPRLATVRIKGMSSYTQGKAFPYGLSKADDETHAQFDERCWRHRAHLPNGHAVIPAMAIHLMLMGAAKARALVMGRDFVTPDDVKAMALPALRHRILLVPEAEVEGKTTDDCIDEILLTIEVPR